MNRIVTYIRSSEFLKDFGGIFVSALIFVISFLWKDLFEDIERIYFPQSKGLWGRVIYIMSLTLFILVSVSYLKKTLDLDTNILFDDNPDHNN